MGSGWKVLIKCGQVGRRGWSSASDTGGVTTHVVHPCPSFPGSNFFFGFWSSQLQEIGEEEAWEQVVSKGHVCAVPAEAEKGRGRA